MAQLEGDGIGKVKLLIRSKRVEKKLGMAKVLLEFSAACPLFNSFEMLGISDAFSVVPKQFKSTSVLGITPFVCSDGLPNILAVRPVIDVALDYPVTRFTISIMAQHWADGTIDRELIFFGWCRPCDNKVTAVTHLLKVNPKSSYLRVKV